MRLSPQAVSAIKQSAHQLLGAAVQVRLFGSRLDDEARGGDIDLHVSLEQSVANPAWSTALLATRLQRQLDGRKVDVRLWWQGLPLQDIDRIALAQGQLL